MTTDHFRLFQLHHITIIELPTYSYHEMRISRSPSIRVASNSELSSSKYNLSHIASTSDRTVLIKYNDDIITAISNPARILPSTSWPDLNLHFTRQLSLYYYRLRKDYNVGFAKGSRRCRPRFLLRTPSSRMSRLWCIHSFFPFRYSTILQCDGQIVKFRCSVSQNAISEGCILSKGVSYTNQPLYKSKTWSAPFVMRCDDNLELEKMTSFFLDPLYTDIEETRDHMFNIKKESSIHVVSDGIKYFSQHLPTIKTFSSQ